MPLHGPLNFRDLGGYQTSTGRRLRSQLVYRSDDLAQLVSQDISRLAPPRLRTVIDLRSNEEVQRRGTFPVEHYPHPVDYHHLPLVEDVIGVRDAGLDDQAYLNSRYEHLLEGGVSSIAQVFRIFARETSYPLVFHCVAGKDRTGVVGAVLLAILGVPDATIVHDYQLTDQATQEWFARARQRNQPEFAQVPNIFFTANPETILHLLGSLRQRWGSIDTWLLHIGVTEDELQSIRQILIDRSST